MKDWEISGTYVLPRILYLKSGNNTMPSKQSKTNLRLFSLNEDCNEWRTWKRSDYFYPEMIPEPDYSDSGDDGCSSEDDEEDSPYSPDPRSAMERLRELTEVYVATVGKRPNVRAKRPAKKQGGLKPGPNQKKGTAKSPVKTTQVKRSASPKSPATARSKSPTKARSKSPAKARSKSPAKARSKSPQRDPKAAAKKSPAAAKSPKASAKTKSSVSRPKSPTVAKSKASPASARKASPVATKTKRAVSPTASKPKPVAASKTPPSTPSKKDPSKTSPKTVQKTKVAPKGTLAKKTTPAGDADVQIKKLQTPPSSPVRSTSVYSVTDSIQSSDEERLIKPKKPYSQDSERQKLHKELKFSQKYGKLGASSKTELQIALERYTENKVKRVMNAEEKTSLEKILEFQAKKIEMQETMEKTPAWIDRLQRPPATLPDPKADEFYRVHARVVCSNLLTHCFQSDDDQSVCSSTRKLPLSDSGSDG